jgi:uncharacterized RDD family membrane protein YckC
MQENNDVKYASFSNRTLALGIDFTILTFLLMPFISITNSWLYGSITLDQFIIPGTNKVDASEALSYLSDNYFFLKYFTVQIITMSVVLLAIFSTWIKFHNTPGKWLLGCKIVDADTLTVPSKRQYMRRIMGYVLSGIPFGAGYFMMVWSDKGQCFHDRMANTLVVKVKHDFTWLRKFRAYITRRINKKSA